MSDMAIQELSSNEMDQVVGGKVTVIAEKGYVGIEISVGGYGVAVWATQGSLCGQVVTPKSNNSGCTP
ncbi:hypothetical protein A5906_35310 [Bradyrhizobium sacchari]|uniref:Uncharacterized protein n=1 Tax=Bradyrhizobium sacchari TaxID=1399419 RepID=A0A560JWV4_9BRAD|nr:hypothetical protein [Bradyrhizobium sacchari]OPY98198.1 hypothetical protein A5906_35310 [Bradyrhizobium sacchari]TWB58810.1 hypothetical protein FBZ94_10586 [Bradyrhizobium sacchari]TWB72830.1 hypothetical protein FBZ95_106545 [Bradyrhizobium sacchari]